jgi:hypothetical protein
MKESTKKVIALRKKGNTYGEIKNETGLAKSTISSICKKYVAENAFIYRDNVKKANGEIPAEQMAAMRAGADGYYKKLRETSKKRWLKALENIDSRQVYYMAGLFDGEGNHTGTGFEISNSDPSIVKFIIRFLQGIEADYKLSLYLHMTHDKKRCEEWWSLPFSVVRQYDTRKQSKDYSATENYGTVRIRVQKPLGLNEALKSYSFTKE